MQLTLLLPDEPAAHLGGEAVHSELERRALEAFAIEELRAGRITELQLSKMLGLARIQLDGFLKSRGIHRDYSLEDFEQERQAPKELGL
jgi:predicted HTH domain antitoxin